MNIKRSATDKYFSDLVREKADWKCELCHKDFGHNRQGLHCSHFIGRGNKAVRWDLDNAAALCGGMAPWGLWGCHKKLTEDTAAHYEFFFKRLGPRRLEALILRSKLTFKDLGMNEQLIKMGLKQELKNIKSKILGVR